jgi:hypothetical protein
LNPVNAIKRVERNKVNSFLRKFIGIYFIGLAVFITIGAWNQVGFREGFNIGDWLINYQGGFVRRGLIGEILYLISKVTGISPVIYLVALQGAIFSVYFYFSWRLLKEKEDLVKYSFLIFSPFLFTYAINTVAGGYRKEIIYFSIISFVSYTYKCFDVEKFQRIFLLLLFFFPLVILTDEVGFVILPLLCGIYWDKVRPRFRDIPLMLPVLLLLNCLIFLAVFFSHHADLIQIKAIKNSLTSVGLNPQGKESGAIDALNVSTEENMKATFHSIIYGHYFIIYPIALILISVAFFPLANEIRKLFLHRFFVLGFAGSFLLLLPVYVIANDWGRWTYILLVEFFFLIVLSDNQNHLRNWTGRWQEVGIGKFLVYFTLLVSYASFWYLPHMLADGVDWRFIIHNVPFLRD